MRCWQRNGQRWYLAQPNSEAPIAYLRRFPGKDLGVPEQVGSMHSTKASKDGRAISAKAGGDFHSSRTIPVSTMPHPMGETLLQMPEGHTLVGPC